MTITYTIHSFLCFSRLTGLQFADWIAFLIIFHSADHAMRALCPVEVSVSFLTAPELLACLSRLASVFFLDHCSECLMCLVFECCPAFIRCVPNFVGIPSWTYFSLNFCYYYVYYYHYYYYYYYYYYYCYNRFQVNNLPLGTVPLRLQDLIPATPPGTNWQKIIHWVDRSKACDFILASCPLKLGGEIPHSCSRLLPFKQNARSKKLNSYDGLKWIYLYKEFTALKVRKLLMENFIFCAVWDFNAQLPDFNDRYLLNSHL